MLHRLLRQLLPGTCLLCDGAIPPHAEPDLCRFCLQVLPWNRGACPRCAHPAEAGGAVGVSAATPTSRSAPGPCHQCAHRPPPFTRSLAPLRYEGDARRWVGRLKDNPGMVEGRILGTLLADAAECFYTGSGTPAPEALIPVPLTALRLARRGHNQAVTLARPVAARLGVPMLRRAVVRQRAGPGQRGLSRFERLENRAGSFAARHRWHDRAPCVAIVDDVMTTGATAAELSRVLMAAGAGEVHVLSATRTRRILA